MKDISVEMTWIDESEQAPLTSLKVNKDFAGEEKGVTS